MQIRPQFTLNQDYCYVTNPGRTFLGKTPQIVQYNGINAANAVNLLAKRR